MKELMLSIVIPVHNAEKYINDCLQAVINQTYNNIEIIVIDDGSTDNTLSILQQYAFKDDRIKIYHHDNKGVSYTRNKGIEVSTGKYVTFIDADDYPEADLAYNYIAAAERWHEKEVSFFMCGMYYDNLYNKNIRNKKYILESTHGYIEGECYLLSRSSAAILAWLGIFNFVTNKCYDLQKIKENNIHFDEGVHIGEDLKFNLDYLDKCPGYIGMKNIALYHYVKRCDDSLSGSYHSQDIEDTKYIYRRFISWESTQYNVLEDNILVLKGIYIHDWVSRLTTYYEQFKGTKKSCMVTRKINKEIRSREFQNTLKEIRKAKKISLLRYICLRTGFYRLFYFFRYLYRIAKG